MKYYKFWIKEDFKITIDGSEETINILSGSNQSEKEALLKASEKARNIEKRISERKPKNTYEVAIKEYVDEIIDDSNIITICRYGAKILNTTHYTILDLDDYPIDFLDFFKGLGKLKKKDRIVHKFEERIRKFPELGTDFRIYETTKGIRVIAKKYIDPSSNGYTNLMRKLHVDWLYIQLSKKQACYRARLTPKPYRMKFKTIKVKSPLDCKKESYINWEQAYVEKSKEYSVVRLVKTVGNDFSRESVIKKHDLMCNLHPTRKLA